MKLALILIFILGLTACGSDSPGTTTAPSRTPLPPATQTPSTGELPALSSQSGVSLYGDTTVTENSSIGFAVIANEREITSVKWRQTAGPDLDILAKNSQTIGFDVPSTGDYSIEADLVLDNGSSVVVTHSFFAASAFQQDANIRLDHTVIERGKVSLRVDTHFDIEAATISWQQVSGPQVLDITAQQNRLFFNAPEVATDSVVEFTATLDFPDGTRQSDRVFITIDNAIINQDGYFFGSNIIATNDMFVFNQNSSFKRAVESCVYNNQLSSTCRFGVLPLIGQTTDNPSVDDIMDRTLVSHQWMGERFKQYLSQSDVGPDMLKLLRGVTAVVISYDVRPSFYWAATGAIYLDADNFWLTPEERDTLNEQPDFRSNFGSQLNFLIPWRYIKNNQYYPNRSYPSGLRESRTFADLEADISWLMYHELGHANDFFPPNSLGRLTANDDPLSVFRNNGTNSDILNVRFPLRSDVMHQLAQVSFAGETPNATQRAYNGDDLVDFFRSDISPAYYAYLNEREDYATLFERFMMSLRLGASADVAIITRQDNPDLIVSWGQRNRFNHPDLQARVRFAVERVLPELGNVAALQEQLPTPISMDITKGWFENVQLDSTVIDPQAIYELQTRSDAVSIAKERQRLEKLQRSFDIRTIHKQQ